MFCLSGFSVLAQTNERQVKDRLTPYFNSYQTEFTTPRDRCKIEKVEIDSKSRTIGIYGNELFSAQPFTEEKVKTIYKEISRLLPPPYNAYHLTVYGQSSPIEELIPSVLREEADRKDNGATSFTGVRPGWKRARSLIPSPKVCRRDISPYGPATDVFTRMRSKPGNGKDHICSVRQKTFSPRLLLFLFLFPCSKMPELMCLPRVSATGSGVKPL